MTSLEHGEGFGLSSGGKLEMVASLIWVLLRYQGQPPPPLSFAMAVDSFVVPCGIIDV